MLGLLRVSIRITCRPLLALPILTALNTGKPMPSSFWRSIAIAPNAAEPVHAFALLKARLGRQQEALELFAKAAKLRPETVRFAYVHGVALHSYGDVDKAIAVLKKAHDTRPAEF